MSNPALLTPGQRAAIVDVVQNLLWPGMYRYMAQAGQTDFILPVSWTPGASTPLAYVNGNRRASGVSQPDGTTVRLATAAAAGDEVLVLMVPGAGSGFLPRSGGSLLSHLDGNGFRLEDIGDPSAAQDAVTKAYLELYVGNVIGGTGGFLKLDGTNSPSADIDMAGNDLAGLPTAAIPSTGGDDLAVSRAQLRAAFALPSGIFLPFGSAAAAPAGWLLCDGTSYETTAYPTLYAAIGYTYGNDSGKFRVPDLRNGRSPVGAGTVGARTFTAGSTGGAADVTLTTSQIPAHDHTYSGLFGTPGAGYVGGLGGTGIASLTSGSAGGGTSHENMPPHVVVPNWIIKV